MKLAAIHALMLAQGRCSICGLDGYAALRGEQQAASARQVWRHSGCDHVLMYRPARLLEQLPISGVRVRVASR